MRRPMDYQVNLDGSRRFVAFECEACKHQLKCPLEEAGLTQKCPTCGAAFVTTGKVELEEHLREEVRRQAEEEAAVTKRKEDERLAAAQAEWQQEHPPQPPNWNIDPLSLERKAEWQQPPQPHLVWYGDMYC